MTTGDLKGQCQQFFSFDFYRIESSLSFTTILRVIRCLDKRIVKNGLKFGPFFVLLMLLAWQRVNNERQEEKWEDSVEDDCKDCYTAIVINSSLRDANRLARQRKVKRGLFLGWYALLVLFRASIPCCALLATAELHSLDNFKPKIKSFSNNATFRDDLLKVDVKFGKLKVAINF